MVSTIQFATYGVTPQLAPTLALLEDTGWYLVAGSAATTALRIAALGRLDWGKDDTCTFLSAACAYSSTDKEFCTASVLTCGNDHTAIGTCAVSGGFDNSCNMVYADGEYGFSCADPSWDFYWDWESRAGIGTQAANFGFGNSYASRCIGLSTSKANGDTYSDGAACLPMSCSGNALQVR